MLLSTIDFSFGFYIAADFTEENAGSSVTVFYLDILFF